MKPPRIPPHLRWFAAIVALLGLSVGANVVMAVFATSDPSVGVIPDYYQRAVDFDRTLAERAASARLGWKVQMSLADVGGDHTELIVVATDADGTPLPADGLAVSVSAFHNARANARVEASLTASPDGAFRAQVPLHRAGLWQFDFELSRGEDRFQTSLRRDVGLRSPAARALR